MTALPSFEELMASLGLDPSPRQSKRSSPSPSSSPVSSPRQVPTIVTSSPRRKTSSPSLKSQEVINASRNRVTRYSPYSSMNSSRRGSLSSSTPTTESDKAHSISPPSSTRIPGRIRIETKLPPNLFDSADLSASTPISAYARRKTPAPSPSSPTFPIDSDFRMVAPMPPSLPSLPNLYTQYNASPSPPLSNAKVRKSGLELPSHNSRSTRSSRTPPEYESNPRICSFRGVRISTPPRAAEVKVTPQVAMV